MGFILSIGSMIGLKGTLGKIVGPILLILLLGGGLFGLKSCYDNSVVERATSKANVKILKKNEGALTKAADDRAAEKVVLDAEKQELQNASAPPPPQCRLTVRQRRGCVILRQQNRQDFATNPTCRGLAECEGAGVPR